MLVPLSTPIVIAGRTVAAIRLRAPGRRAFEAMRLARGPVRFAEDAVIRFAARLSDHSEPTFRRLSPEDMAAIGLSVEELYRQARRRFAARSALIATARAEATAQREACEE